eukprot:TRINITY_DN9593_c0_g1_i1.p1 TRINITY_DN9593_c0_g1~~TRINITY_DN9593_c0_g1_i1.p1  ORF type:complete len:103 (+),score=4.51 TRINITY_DN9593_c0_g1_i1:13-321(+)
MLALRTIGRRKHQRTCKTNNHSHQHSRRWRYHFSNKRRFVGATVTIFGSLLVVGGGYWMNEVSKSLVDSLLESREILVNNDSTIEGSMAFYMLESLSKHSFR